jgi:hypothetical protein
MKRTAIFLSALALVFAASCQRIEETFVQNGTVSGEQLTFEATIAEATPSAAVPGDEPGTKTAIQENGTDIYWTPGDAINLFFGSSPSSKFSTNITSPSRVAGFYGDIGAVTGSSEAGMGAQTFWGIYPYDPENTCDGNNVTLKILGTQVASPGSFGIGMNPSIANAPGLGLAFYNVGSWLRFSVSQEGITSATFSGNNGEILAGKVTVKMDSDNKPAIENIEGGLKSITVTPEGGGSFVPNMFYYITLIPQVIASTGYTLTLYKGNLYADCVTADPKKLYNFARSKYRSKTDADEGLEWGVAVDGLSFDYPAYALEIGKTVKLTATVSPADATNKAVTWESANPRIASVTSLGFVTGKMAGTTTITAKSVQGNHIATCSVTVLPEVTFVNMGDGNRWATKNVGADKTEEYGGYFAWGETQTKETYNWTTYKYGTGFDNITKYKTTDGKTVLEAGDDAAKVNMGSNWRMATDDEWTWLRKNCTWTWCLMNGVTGIVVTSRIIGYESSALFLPAAGWSVDQHINGEGTNGSYWSSTHLGTVDGTSYAVEFTSSNLFRVNATRYAGRSVRAVRADIEPNPEGFINGHEYVEMGDGLKWATVNVGATTPQGYGDYFAWGETAAKSDYSWDTYFDTTDGGATFTKYVKDGKTVLDPENDAARANWGGSWRMPTNAEWTALKAAANFTWTWTADYEGTGIAGRIVTSKVSGYEGNSIFLPAAGLRDGAGWYLDYEPGSNGDYWSSTLNENNSVAARAVDFYYGNVQTQLSYFRRGGLSVRAVSD